MFNELGNEMKAKPMEGFSKGASDLFKIAVLMAGFDKRDLLMRCHKRGPKLITVKIVEDCCQEIRDEWQQNIEDADEVFSNVDADLRAKVSSIQI